MKRATTHLLRQSIPTSSSSSRLSSQAASCSHGFRRLARQASTSSSVEKAAVPPLRPVASSLPNNTPQEDYASPTMYTFGIIGRLFRYSIYASVFIVVGGSAMYAAVHAYVEYVALHGRSPLTLDEEQELYYQLEDLLPGYSGAHLGGGTDPGLGWRGRNAARAAWIATHLRRGGITTRVRGQHSDIDIPDSAWLEAEKYLLFALQEADKQNADNRFAKRELLQQLAEIRSSMAGARGLAESKRNFQELIQNLSEDSTPNEATKNARLLHLETRLAMVDMRIVRELLSRSAAGRAKASAELSRTLQRLEGAIMRSTGTSEIKSVAAVEQAGLPPSDHEHRATSEPTGMRSWLSWKDKHNSPLKKNKSSVRSELVSFLHAVPVSISPILLRALVASCITLSGTLAEEKHLEDSLAIAQAAKTLLSSSLESAIDLPNSASPEHRQHALWIRGRQATLNTMLAEIAYATGNIDSQGCDRLLSQAVRECQSCLNSIPSWPKGSLLHAAHRLCVLSQSEAIHLRRTGISAAQIKGVLAENTQRSYKQALGSYETALAFTNEDVGGGQDDQTLVKSQLLEAIRRCRNKLLPLDTP